MTITIKDIKISFETKKRKSISWRPFWALKRKNYYKPVKMGNFWSNNYIEYESNGDRNKIPLVEKYL